MLLKFGKTLNNCFRHQNYLFTIVNLFTRDLFPKAVTLLAAAPAPVHGPADGAGADAGVGPESGPPVGLTIVVRQAAALVDVIAALLPRGALVESGRVDNYWVALPLAFSSSPLGPLSRVHGISQRPTAPASVEYT